MTLLTHARRALAVAACAALAAPAAFAETNSGDTAWMLTATAFVLMMTLPPSPCSTAGWCSRRTYSPCSASASSSPA